MRTRRGIQFALFVVLTVLVSSSVTAQDTCTPSDCEGPNRKGSCVTTCDVAGRAANAACETKVVKAPVCGASGTTCGTVTTFGFDPALNAHTDVARVTPQDLGFVSLNNLIEPLRAQYRIPALAVAVVRSSGVVAVGAVGVRVAGAGPRVSPLDRFHLGSCGKSITASVAAAIVEQRKISWDTTIADVFGDDLPVEPSPYRDVTLAQLLSHRSGLPSRTDDVMIAIWALDGNANARREAFVRFALRLEPAAAPGSAFVYSDIGYTVAGAMLERALGRQWESLVHEYVARPLGLTSLGFGEPATPGHMDHPWGHIADGIRAVPFPPGPFAAIDNPAVIGPAGLVHLSIVDWGTYASDHLKGARGRSGSMLSPASYKELHTDVDNQSYGMGWAVSDQEPGRTISHTGSCGEWFSLIRIIPDADIAVVVATNVSGGTAAAASTEALEASLAYVIRTTPGAE